MSESWVYRVGLTLEEVDENAIKQSGFEYELVEVEITLRAHIDETLGKPYKFYTSMREDAPNYFSCSSLISYLYIFAGIWMPSLVIDKFFYAKQITKEELRFGDLVFTTAIADNTHPQRTTSVEYKPGELTSERPVTHVMMCVDDGNILHASPLSQKGRVVMEKLDDISKDNTIGYGRVVEDLKEKRFVIDIPNDRPDLRNREALLKVLKG